MSTSVDDTRLTLLHRLQSAGTDEDWQDFYRMYWRIVQRWLRRRRVSDKLAEDVFHQTMIQVVRQLPAYEHRGPGTFRGWLKTITMCRLKDYYRWEGKHQAVSSAEPDSAIWDLPDDGHGEQTAPDDDNACDLDKAWMEEVFEAALAAAEERADPRVWECFRRYVLEEESVHKVSADVGLTPGAIYQQKSRVLDYVREEFERILNGYDDLRPEWRRTDEAVSAIRHALAEYLEFKHDPAQTAFVPEPPAELTQGLDDVRGFMQETPPPQAGDWLVQLDSERRCWRSMEQPTLICGRDLDCDICLDGNGISDRHCRLDRLDGGWQLDDLGSTNGTWVNGESVSQPTPLRSGDRIRLAETLLIYLDIDSDEHA